ncbi:hypothetical protein M0802_004488 [Mischocyttarus mexicanus]|nr:hypothetical protein M0802_004488 [Mischocyttarus mexicanus]
MSTQAYYKERLGFDPADTVAEHHREQRSQHGYEESLSKFKGQNGNGYPTSSLYTVCGNKRAGEELEMMVTEQEVDEDEDEDEGDQDEEEEVVVVVEEDTEEDEEEEGVVVVEEEVVEEVDVLEEQRSSSTQTAFWGCWAMFIESHGRRTRRHTKEDLYEMGEQTLEKGKQTCRRPFRRPAGRAQPYILVGSTIRGTSSKRKRKDAFPHAAKRTNGIGFSSIQENQARQHTCRGYR